MSIRAVGGGGALARGMLGVVLGVAWVEAGTVAGQSPTISPSDTLTRPGSYLRQPDPTQSTPPASPEKSALGPHKSSLSAVQPEALELQPTFLRLSQISGPLIQTTAGNRFGSEAVEPAPGIGAATQMLTAATSNGLTFISVNPPSGATVDIASDTTGTPIKFVLAYVVMETGGPFGILGELYNHGVELIQSSGQSTAFAPGSGTAVVNVGTQVVGDIDAVKFTIYKRSTGEQFPPSLVVPYVAHFIRSPTTPPGAFSLLGTAMCKRTPPTSPAVDLTWGVSSGAAGYSVYRNGALVSPGLTQTSFDDTANVTPGQTYSYFVRATNSIGTTDSNTVSVSVPQSVCAECSVACSTTVPTSAAANVPVQFQATASATNCSGAVTYDWDFGDGSPHAFVQNPSHSYAALGSYQWTMTATAQGQTCPKRGTVTVHPPVLFVHGYCSDGTMWNSMISTLQELNPERYGTTKVDLYFDGHDVKTKHGDSTVIPAAQVYTITFYSVALEFVKDAVAQLPVELLGYQLAQVVQTIREVNGGIPQVDIVSHSMGGLVARSYIEGFAQDFGVQLSPGPKQPYLDDVRRLVTIDTPHQGSDRLKWCLDHSPCVEIAQWFAGCQFDESVQRTALLPGSDFLNKLNNVSIPKPPELVTAIASHSPSDASGDYVVTTTSQDITKVPMYSCSSSDEKTEGVGNIVPDAPLLPYPQPWRAHTDVCDKVGTVALVAERIGARSVTRSCQTLIPGTPTVISTDSTAGMLAYRVDLSFSASGTAITGHNSKAVQVCTVDVIARSDTGAELARRSVPADGFQSVSLGVLPGSGWHVELVPTCATVVSATVTALPTCGGDPSVMCLNDNRFAVQVSWRAPSQGLEGVGNAVPISGDTGYFWFFKDSNVELVVKVLDARPIGDSHFWVFYGALSDVEYTITVTDTATGAVKNYFNPSGHLASVADTTAFQIETTGSESVGTPEKGGPVELAKAGPDAELYAAYGALADTKATRVAAEANCAGGSTTLCLNQSRFQVTVDRSVPADGRSGHGMAVPVTGDTGYFWFFNDANVELVIKVLDGGSINGHFWVFYGALSNVQYTITVTDTQTGARKQYTNPNGTFASFADTTAF